MSDFKKYDNALIKRSAEMDEIIGKPPSWLIKWGTTIFFVILIIVFALSYFITYSESINIPIRIAHENLRFSITEAKKGIIQEIFITPGQKVTLNELLYRFKSIDGTITTRFSPDSGFISYIAPFFEGQKIDKEQILFFISPSDFSFYGISYVDEATRQRIRSGVLVSANFADSSGNTETLFGKVNYVSDIQSKEGYYIKVDLSQASAQTKKLGFIDGERGSAEILLSKKRLFEKLYAGAFSKN